MCTTLKILNIQWNAPTIPPSEGYTIRYRPVGASNWTTHVLANPVATSVAIPNVQACTDVEVSIQANCGDGRFGFETTTIIPAGSRQCRDYQLVNSSGQSITYSYFTCDGVEMSTNLAAGQTTYFTASTDYGSIRTSGGTLTQVTT
jgi:hypothetical protein